MKQIKMSAREVGSSFNFTATQEDNGTSTYTWETIKAAQLCMIAEVLTCPNVRRIPSLLGEILAELRGIRRDAKQRPARRGRKGK